MPLLISDRVVVSGASGYSGVAQQPVIIYPLSVPLFVKNGTVWNLLNPANTTVVTASDGSWSTQLPWPSEQDPSTIHWVIQLPDGSQWSGAVPNLVTGPVTVNDLKNLYGWGLVNPSPAQQVITIQGPAGGSLSATPVKTSNYTAAPSDLVLCNPIGGAFTVTLPTSPPVNTVIAVKNKSASNNTITVAAGGANTIDGASTAVITAARECLEFIYDGVSDWQVV